MLLVGLILVRSMTARLCGLTAVMQRLAAQDLTMDVPTGGSRDEIGVMAETVLVFKDSMIESGRIRG